MAIWNLAALEVNQHKFAELNMVWIQTTDISMESSDYQFVSGSNSAHIIAREQRRLC